MSDFDHALCRSYYQVCSYMSDFDHALWGVQYHILTLTMSFVDLIVGCAVLCLTLTTPTAGLIVRWAVFHLVRDLLSGVQFYVWLWPPVLLLGEQFYMTTPCARLIVGCAVLYLTLTTPCTGLIISCAVLYLTLTTPCVGLIVLQLGCFVLPLILLLLSGRQDTQILLAIFKEFYIW